VNHCEVLGPGNLTEGDDWGGRAISTEQFPKRQRAADGIGVGIMLQ